MIRVEDLTHIYNPDSDPVKAINNIEINIEKGSNTVILGENGSGKTTLVKHFNGLLKPSNGNVIVDGDNTKDNSIAEMSRKVGFVFQNPEHQIFEKNVLEEIKFGPNNLDIDVGDRIDEILRLMDIVEYKERSPHNLSGGEKQRLAIASILIMDPDYLVLDEPTTGLDLKGMNRILDIIDELKDRDKTVITVTHDLELAKHADEVLVLKNGEIKMKGSPEEVLGSEKLESYGLRSPDEVTLSKELGIIPKLTPKEIVESMKGERDG